MQFQSPLKERELPIKHVFLTGSLYHTGLFVCVSQRKPSRALVFLHWSFFTQKDSLCLCKKNLRSFNVQQKKAMLTEAVCSLEWSDNWLEALQCHSHVVWPACVPFLCLVVLHLHYQDAAGCITWLCLYFSCCPPFQVSQTFLQSSLLDTFS